MTEQALRIVREFGGTSDDAHTHRSLALTDASLLGSDLVLAMRRTHRREVVGRAPSRVKQTFTLREFAYLVDYASPEILGTDEAVPPATRLHRLTAALAAARASAASAELDVIDPYGQSDQTYRECARQLVPAAESLARLLRHLHTGSPLHRAEETPRRRGVRAPRREEP